MEKKTLAILIIIIIGVGAIGAWYFIGVPAEEGWPPPPPISSYSKKIVISEVHYLEENELEDYIELYLWEDLTTNMSGWTLTTFDDDEETLPAISGLRKLVYLIVYMGDGTNELDASDGLATIFLGRTESMLDDGGDEVALYDNAGEIADYIRYSGGNGGPIYGDWSKLDGGVSASQGESLQILGEDLDDSSDWCSEEPTPNGPNAYTFLEDGVKMKVYNGLNFGAPTEGVVAIGVVPQPTNPADATTIKKVKEWAGHCQKFYEKEGFSNPMLGPDGAIDVHLGQEPAGGPTCSSGVTHWNGSIYVTNGTVKSAIDLKYVLEHEMCHMYQLGNWSTDKGDYTKFASRGTDWKTERFWDEGMAVFFGTKSVMEEFNKTLCEMMQEYRRVGDHNWYEHFRNPNASSPFGNWTGSFDDYIGSFMFLKWLNETYGHRTIMNIYCNISYYYNQTVKSTLARQAIEKILGLGFDQVLRKFQDWLYQDAPVTNCVPAYPLHGNFTWEGFQIWPKDGIYVEPWGTVFYDIAIESYNPFFLYIGACLENPSSFVGTVKFYGLDGTVLFEKPFNADVELYYFQEIMTPQFYSHITLIITRIGDTGNGLIWPELFALYLE